MVLINNYHDHPFKDSGNTIYLSINLSLILKLELQVETETLHKYDLLHGFTTKIIPYVGIFVQEFLKEHWRLF